MAIKNRKRLKTKPKILSKSRQTIRSVIGDAWAEGGEIHTESLVERDSVMALRWLDDGIEIDEQPFTTTISIYGKETSYTPDLSVRVKGESTSLIIECKTQSILDKYPAEVQKLECIKNSISEIGYSFLPITDGCIKSLRKQIQMLKTVKLNTSPISPDQLEHLKTLLPATIGHLQKHGLYSEVLRGLAHKQVFLEDIQKTINKNSLISVNGGYSYEKIFAN